MREIVLDTETTGLDPFKGHKIVEIGCVELENHMPTGRTFQEYINPEREMDEDVIAVHGITNEFVKDKPIFKEVAEKFLNFIGDDSKLVIHNASFDMKFLNYELEQCGYKSLSYDRVIDTLVIAKQKFPGSRVNLNELCKRFNIDTSARVVHGALLDSELLADVYLELIGGREPGLTLHSQIKKEPLKENTPISVNRTFREPRIFEISEIEIKEHIEFIKKIKNNLWGINE